MRSLIAFVACLFPALATAQSSCPSDRDLSGPGIRVDRSGGYTEIFRAGGQGIVMVEGFIDRELEYNLELADGLQLLSYSGNVGKTPDAQDGLRYDYGVPHDDLPGPVANERWQSEVTVTGVGGSFSEPQLYASGPQEQISIGNCPYTMIPVTIAYQNAQNYIEVLQFFPEMGIAVLIRQSDDMAAATDFTIERIGLARQ